MKFAKISALVALIATVGVSAFAKTPAPTAPKMAAPPAAHTLPRIDKIGNTTAVKGYDRKLKNGKTVHVKGHNRVKAVTAPPKTVAVKGYDRKLKNGKIVHVNGYNRMKAGAKKTAAPAAAPKM